MNRMPPAVEMDVVVGPKAEGARRATGVSADGAAVGSGALAPGQRWSASRKRDVVLRLLRGANVCPRNRVRYTSSVSHFMERNAR